MRRLTKVHNSTTRTSVLQQCCRYYAVLWTFVSRIYSSGYGIIITPLSSAGRTHVQHHLPVLRSLHLIVRCVGSKPTTGSKSHKQFSFPEFRLLRHHPIQITLMTHFIRVQLSRQSAWFGTMRPLVQVQLLGPICEVPLGRMRRMQVLRAPSPSGHGEQCWFRRFVQQAGH